MQRRIMTAAVYEINERGIKFTMGDLARRLGVSKRCIYQHFSSKEELVSAISFAVLSDICEQRRNVIEDESLSFPEKLRKVLTVQPKVGFFPCESRIYIEIRRLFPAVWAKMDQYMSQDWRVIEEFLREGIRQGQFRAVYVPIIESMIKGTIKEIVNYHFLAVNNVSLEQANEYMVDILLDGLLPR